MKVTVTKGKINKPKKPAKLYADELFKRGLNLSIGLREKYRKDYKWEYVNREQNLSCELCTELLHLYENAKIVSSPKPEGARWQKLEEKIGGEYKYAKLLAPAMNMKEKDVNDSELLREERRAKKLGVCCALMGLHLWSGSEAELLKRFARTGEVKWKQAQEKEHNIKHGVAEDDESWKPCADEKQLAEIRKISQLFGYYLPEKADDVRRIDLFNQIRAQARELGWDTEKTLDLKLDVIDTLEKFRSEWSENPNRLHVLIAAAPKDVKSLKEAYHALALHPVGLEKMTENTSDPEKIRKALVMPVDQMVVTAGRYLYPLAQSVKPYKKGDNAEAFWCLLYSALDYWDYSETYIGMKMKLCDQLFFSTNKEDTWENKLSLFDMYFGNIGKYKVPEPESPINPALAFDPRVILEANEKKKKEQHND